MMEKTELKRHPETDELVPEKWKDIEGYEGRYQVSNYGRVKSLKRKGVRRDKILKGAIKMLKNKTRTYRFVHLSDGSSSDVYYIHILVADAFIDEVEGKDCINHKDLDKLNNFYLNLERCTHKENIHHAFENGAMQYDLLTEEVKLKRLGKKRKKKWHKISYNDAVQIRSIYTQGWFTQREIAKAYNVDQTMISRIILKKAWYDENRYNLSVANDIYMHPTNSNYNQTTKLCIQDQQITQTTKIMSQLKKMMTSSDFNHPTSFRAS